MSNKKAVDYIILVHALIANCKNQWKNNASNFLFITLSLTVDAVLRSISEFLYYNRCLTKKLIYK